MLDVCGDKMHYTDQWTSQIKELKFKSMTFFFSFFFFFFCVEDSLSFLGGILLSQSFSIYLCSSP